MSDIDGAICEACGAPAFDQRGRPCCGEHVVFPASQPTGTELEQLRAENRRLRWVVSEVMDIVSGSEGVAGWHRNGDIAQWDEFEFVAAASEVLADKETGA